jgi:Predicted O-methyltransferase|tara:strand:+ start:218 stop:838 length:621 start_codon:yes stop_codon:yes gene_type:complete
VANNIDYIIQKINNIKNINILELGVLRGDSTNKFLEICEKNDGYLTSIDIEDCSYVSKSRRWKFIHSSDDDFDKIDKIISKNFDFIFVDSLHEPNHVKKIFYHYYNFLKNGGICIIDDISWLPYTKHEYRDNEFSENINKSTFNMILEIYYTNKENFNLEFFFKDTGYAIINKKSSKILNPSKKIISREYGIKNFIRKFYKRMPKK